MININIDTIKCSEFKQNVIDICQIISEQQEKLQTIEKEIKNMLPRGYWYTYDIDQYPKKYGIRDVKCSQSHISLRIKDVGKKNSWHNQNEHFYDLEGFLNLNIYKTEQEAVDAYKRRICSKCGGFMMLSRTIWCTDCMQKRQLAKYEFDQTHKFYDPVKRSVYTIEYVDELTRDYGFEGKLFTIRRKDTGEIIHTNNLWVWGYSTNPNNFPEIEFIEEDSN